MGLSLEYFKNIPGLELRKMTDAELKVVLQNIAMHTNARLSQLKKAGLTDISKSAHNLTKNYPQGLSSKGAKRGDLLKQIKAGQRFLKGSTSTVSGTKKMVKNLFDLFGGKYDYSKTTFENYASYFGSDFWEIYRRLESENKSYKEDSEGLIQSISEVIEEREKGEDRDTYIREMLNKARDRYTKNTTGEDINFASDEDLANKYKRR